MSFFSFLFFNHCWQRPSIEASPKTMKMSHWKQCFELELQFDFLVLRELQTAAIFSTLRSQPHFNIHISPLTQCLPLQWEYNLQRSTAMFCPVHITFQNHRTVLRSSTDLELLHVSVLFSLSFVFTEPQTWQGEEGGMKKINCGPNIDITCTLNSLSPPNTK